MTGPRDLFGNPLTVVAVGSPRALAQRLYAEGDMLPHGSAARRDLYARAAEAQRAADQNDQSAQEKARKRVDRVRAAEAVARENLRRITASRGGFPGKRKASAAPTAEAG